MSGRGDGLYEWIDDLCGRRDAFSFGEAPLPAESVPRLGVVAAWKDRGCLPPGAIPLVAAMSDGTQFVIVGANANVYAWTPP